MARYVMTGATGLLGRNLLPLLLSEPDADVHVVVRAQSLGRLQAQLSELPGGERVTAITGDLTEDGLGISVAVLNRLRGTVDHLVHLAALYDMTADSARNDEVNIAGTRRVVELAEDLHVGCLHHVSSIAVAGHTRGTFTEDDFERGQSGPSPYHRTKYESERLVRDASVPWRVYRPSIVVGDTRTGAMDKIDGPYYFFPLFAWISELPTVDSLPLVMPDMGFTNIVPVDYVVDAMYALMHRPGIDGRAFHLGSAEPQKLVDVYNAFAEVAGAPKVRVTLPLPLAPVAGALSRIPLPGAVRSAGELALSRLAIPPEVIPHAAINFRFTTDSTRAELDALDVPPPPPLADYAGALWTYWAENLDPYRFRRRRPGGALDGRVVAVTGASSGIGRAAALQIAARGGIPLLLARRTAELEEVREEIEAAGGSAFVYSVDLTDQDSVDSVVKQMLADHGGVDMLVNNAGRSIRRSVKLSLDRMHDYERTMALNYFAPVRLVLALLPSMCERRFGHIVNVSSIGVQTNVPRFSAYVASKAALDAFSRVVSSELLGDGITFTTVHMPLVRTPMIAPTTMYDRFPAMSPDEAGAVIVKALETKPRHWGSALGTAGAVATTLAPRLAQVVAHTGYLVFPDSAAAAGARRTRTSTPEALSRGAVVMARLLPGIHW